MNESERKAVESGQGAMKNGRYFNAGKTYEADGRTRFDFDEANKHDPAFTGDVFLGYEDDVPVFGPRGAS